MEELLRGSDSVTVEMDRRQQIDGLSEHKWPTFTAGSSCGCMGKAMKRMDKSKNIFQIYCIRNPTENNI